MRHSIARGCAVAAIPLLGALPALAQDGNLRIYSAYPDEHMAALIEGFGAQYPDVDVQVSVQPGEQLLSTLELELRANAPQADLVGLNQASIAALAADHDAFAEYRPEGLTNVRENLRDASGLSVPACVNVYLIQYNTNAISEDEAPESWMDLTDPQWADQVAMADPASSQSIQSFLWFISEYLPQNGNGDFGWDYFGKLTENGVRLEGSHGTIRDLTAAGERPLAVQLLANGQTSANRGDPTSLVWPTEGSPGEVSSFAMLDGAANREAAQAWLDFIVSPEAQAIMPDALGCAPVLTEIGYSFPDGTAVGDVDIVAVDSTWIAENREAQIEAFEEATGN
ncbi:ABC transporter substrate-binding protein [Tropicimonas sp. IMCC34011]|uniref:ABC transporter substrate-binding protein n=1 Tax=Tropicimonas sp. IMCC34011 TaxID=2248759 RepID=UPI00130056F2|nr:extracellular solute-binding protein [Tropicimonas sp. IMCC34011]